MLQTQVDYWKLQEQKRANREQERLKQIELDLRSKELDETTRHDLQGEAENLRSHLKSEEQRGYEIGNATMDVNTRIKQADVAERKLDIDSRNASAAMLRAQGTVMSGQAAKSQAATAKQRSINDNVHAAEQSSNRNRGTDLEQRKVEKSERMETWEKGEKVVKGLTEGAKAGSSLSGGKGSPKAK